MYPPHAFSFGKTMNKHWRDKIEAETTDGRNNWWKNPKRVEKR
jgi:hypothetical protein